MPRFSGFICYETEITLKQFSRVSLEITDAHEGVEVFVNGNSAGIQILPMFSFDITAFCIEGVNKLRIEVATTLERENSKKWKEAAPTRITGEVRIKVRHSRHCEL